MTTLAVPAARLGRSFVDRATIDAVRSLVRRRVPASDVEDVVHQAVQEALEAPAPPDTPPAFRRWLFGIVRHKVADYHRARQRVGAQGLPDDLAAASAPLEARSLLRTILDDLTQDARAAETMRWIAREAEGEALESLAREAALPAATVRQRVSRLRRWLRGRWGAEALVFAGIGVLVLALARARTDTAPLPLYADPAGDSAAAAEVVLQGTWKVESFTADRAVAPSRRALLDAEAMASTVTVAGRQVSLGSPARRTALALEVGAVDHGVFEVRLVDASGHAQRASVRVEGPDRLVLRADGGDWAGTVTLVRR